MPDAPPAELHQNGGIESVGELDERLVAALQDVRSRDLVVSHAGPIRRILHLMGLPARDLMPCEYMTLSTECEAPPCDSKAIRAEAVVLTPGEFAGIVVFVGDIDDLQKVDQGTLALLQGCSRAVAMRAMDLAGATVNLTGALTSHLSYGRLSPKPYAVALHWPDGIPRHGQFCRLLMVQSKHPRPKTLFPDVEPVSPAPDEQLGGKWQGLTLLKSLGARVPVFYGLEYSTLACWQEAGDFERCAQDWCASVALDRRHKWAARSSADIEDSVRQPLSGLFQSVLDVDTANLPHAIAQVFASAGSAEVIDRLRIGSISSPPRMAVVVQAMVENPLLSGAVFVPWPPNPGCLVIEARLKSHGNELMDGSAPPEATAEFSVHGDANYIAIPEHLEVDTQRIRDTLAVVAREATAIYSKTGYGDLEFCVEQEGTVWWLQARALLAAVEVVDRRGFAPAARQYYEELAFRVHEANLMPPTHFRCVTMPDGRFGYTVGIRHRDRAFHALVQKDPSHLVHVTNFGWRIEKSMSEVARDFQGRDPHGVLSLLTLHGAVQLPFSIPMASTRMDRFESEAVDAFPTDTLLEEFLGRTLNVLRSDAALEDVLLLLRHPARTSLRIESLKALSKLLRAGPKPGDDVVLGHALLSFRDVPDLTLRGMERLREMALRELACSDFGGPTETSLLEQLAESTARFESVRERRAQFLRSSQEDLPVEVFQELHWWADYLEMKAETNETHAVYRGQCFLWFARIGFAPTAKQCESSR